MKPKNWRLVSRKQARRANRSRFERLEERTEKKVVGRDFPDEIGKFGQPTRKAVCRRCHCVIQDFEPCSPHGEFRHPASDKDGNPHWCPNAGIEFTTRNFELVPFMPKSRRRFLKRAGIRP